MAFPLSVELDIASQKESVDVVLVSCGISCQKLSVIRLDSPLQKETVGEFLITCGISSRKLSVITN